MKTKRWMQMTAAGMSVMAAAAMMPAAALAEGADEDRTLSIALQSSTNVDYEDNYFTKYLEDMTGIHIELTLLPANSDELKTKLALMVSGKDDLPDVLITDALSQEIVLNYGQNGIFLPIEDYLNDADKMPNYNAIPEEDKEDITSIVTLADGHIYGFPHYDLDTWNATPNRIYINRAWLDTLGLEMPTTTDELKEVLIAFRDQDPNGNGLKDEIPLYGCQQVGYGGNIAKTLMNSFIYYNGTLALDENNEVMSPVVEDAFREGLRYMNDLYEEGLMTAAIFTDDSTQFKATLNQEPGVVGYVSAGSVSNWPDAKNNQNFLEMELTAPVSGPDGVQYSPYSKYFGWSTYSAAYLFSGTEKADLAAELMDAFYDSTVSMMNRYGEKDVDWTDDPEVLKNESNDYVEAGLYDSVKYKILNDVWSESSTKKFWHNIGPRYCSLDDINRISPVGEYSADDPSNLYGENLTLYADLHPEYVLPSILHYTAEETEEIQQIMTDVDTYASQSMAEFITGARDIETDWDDYLEELDNLGLQTWIECAQQAYTRSTEK